MKGGYDGYLEQAEHVAAWTLLLESALRDEEL